MSRLTRVSLLCVVLLGCVAGAFAQGLSAPPVEYNESAWKEFSSPEGRFSVLLPGTPNKQTQRIPTPDGKGVEVTIHTLRTFATYGVIYADYPFPVAGAEMSERLLDEGAKGAVAQVGAELLSIEEVSLGGHPGRALREKLPSGEVMHIRMYLVGSRLYQIAITLPKEDGMPQAVLRFRGETAAKFLDSFKLLPDAKDSAEARPLWGDPKGVAAPAEAEPEGEVYALLRRMRDKGEDVGVIVGAADESGRPPSAGGKPPGVLTGKAIQQTAPEYPPIAKAARAQGAVSVLILVDEQGRVVAAQAHRGHPLLQAAAVKAVRGWRFSPTLLDGKPVKVMGTVTVNFALQ